MSKQEMVVAIIAIATVGGTLMTIVTSWFRYEEKKLEVNRRASGGLNDDRLARIETAIEAMAVEVERISEGQRFTSKLLADRQHAPAIAVGERRIPREER